MAVERGALCDIYGYLKLTLAASIASAASLEFASSSRSNYLSSLLQLRSDLLLLVPELGTIVNGFAGPDYAEILVMRDNEDQTRSGYHIQMVRDANGVWRIRGM